jgi:hypothetical protein
MSLSNIKTQMVTQDDTGLFQYDPATKDQNLPKKRPISKTRKKHACTKPKFKSILLCLPTIEENVLHEFTPPKLKANQATYLQV